MHGEGWEIRNSELHAYWSGLYELNGARTQFQRT